MRHLLKRFGSCDRGATSIEYGLIAVLIAVAIVTAVTVLGTNLSDLFDSVSAGF